MKREDDRGKVKLGQVFMSNVNVSLELSDYRGKAHASVIANPGIGGGGVTADTCDRVTE